MGSVKKFVSATLVIFLFLNFLNAQTIDLSKGWKFKTGDNPEWANPSFNDNEWPGIVVEKSLENLGIKQEKYSWYRIKFYLSSEIKNKSFLKDSLNFYLGKIDECDQVYLNGILIGQNNGINSEKFEGVSNLWEVERNYNLLCTNPVLKWNTENVLAIRVYNGGGYGGGMIYGKPFVGMLDLLYYVKINRSGITIKSNDNNNFDVRIEIANSYAESMEGSLKVQLKSIDPRHKLVKEFTQKIVIEKNNKSTAAFILPNVENTEIWYSFSENKSKKELIGVVDIPFILTPKSSKNPKINGAKIFGVRPNNPVLFKVPVTGEIPIIFSAENLPKGLFIDKNTGIITGKISEKGEYKLKIIAENSLGKNTREFKIVCGDKIALTPPMGWNSWNCWGLSVSEEKVKSSADALISSGLINHGWTYMNIDDGWELVHEGGYKKMLTNEKFPDMRRLADYIHSKGLKLGIYSSPGPKTCGGFEGSYGYENLDAKAYEEWNIDYLKYDWCSYGWIYPNPTIDELKKPYFVMQKALSNVNRDIVYSLCQYGLGNVWEWGGEVGGNCWRTTGDITDTWESMSKIGFSQAKCSPYAKPGNWNDPDMLVVGKVGWGPNLHPTRLTYNEQYTHISLWALLSSPLLIGCDLAQLDEFTLNLLSNDEVIDIDQDPLGKQAVQLFANEQYEIWVKDLEDGTKAVGLFNKTTEAMKISLDFNNLKISKKQLVRDVWRQKDLGTFANQFESLVPSHGVCLIKLHDLTEAKSR